MYNRYIPQPDGSYRRNRVPEPNRPAPPQSRGQPQEQRQPQPCPDPKPEPPKQSPPQPQRRCNNQRSRPHPPRQEPPKTETSVTGFLRRLLPKDFDTGDLLIVLLLLLMAGDCAEDQNTALLTLVLYIFM